MLSQIDKQIFRSWREYMIEPRLAKITGRVLHQTGPRIAVIGNCQSYGIAYAMKVMDPSASIAHFSVIGRSRASLELLAKTLDRFDYVFSHPFPDGHVRGGGSDELQKLLPKTRMFPPIVFAAFHPDLIYVEDKSARHGFVFGPLGPYHSSLALFAYRKGLSLEEANALFNENVFQLAGFFDFWNDSARELIDPAKERYGLDLSNQFVNWARRGVFMYSPVHPMGFVLHDLARLLLENAGLKPAARNFGYYDIQDLARAEIFPLYPPIVKQFGTVGSYLFKAQNHHLSSGVGRFFTLPQFLRGSYESFEKHKASLQNARVDVWLADEEISGALMRLARENLRSGKTPAL